MRAYSYSVFVKPPAVHSHAITPPCTRVDLSRIVRVQKRLQAIALTNSTQQKGNGFAAFCSLKAALYLFTYKQPQVSVTGKSKYQEIIYLTLRNCRVCV